VSKVAGLVTEVDCAKEMDGDGSAMSARLVLEIVSPKAAKNALYFICISTSF